MEHDRAEIRIFFCSEMFLPLGHEGWRHQAEHHRNACSVSQRKKISPASASGPVCAHRPDCSLRWPDKIITQLYPSLSIVCALWSSAFSNSALSPHWPSHEGQYPGEHLSWHCQSLKCSAHNSEAFSAQKLCVGPMSYPISSQVSFWLSLGNIVLQGRSKNQQLTNPKLIESHKEILKRYLSLTFQLYLLNLSWFLISSAREVTQSGHWTPSSELQWPALWTEAII